MTLLADLVVEANAGGAMTHIPLAGVTLGNGYVDPLVQTQALIDFATAHDLIDAGMRVGLDAAMADCTAGVQGECDCDL